MRAGIYTYPWDLAAEGHDVALGRIAENGFTAVNLAVAYHAGRFLLPHNPQRRVYFAEDGALYFRPNRAKKVPGITPRLSSLVRADGDPLRDLDLARRAHGLELTAWTVVLHNTWLGERHPERCLINCFGDPYIHSLCPADPVVREYAVALVTDITSHADLAAIELESAGYMGYRHGFHHEIDGVPLDPVQTTLLSLSFHPAELARAKDAGIDGDGVQKRVARALLDCWEGRAPLYDADEPTRAAEMLVTDSDYQAYLGLRRTIAHELAADLYHAIKDVNRNTEVRHFAALNPGEMPDDPGAELAHVADAILAGYALSDDDVAVRVGNLRDLMPDTPVWGMLRAIQPDATTPDQAASRVAAWRQAGVAGLNVYNYGLMPLSHLDAVGQALRED